MAAFYQTASASPVEYIQDLNLPLMERALLTNDAYITQANEQAKQLENMSISFNKLAVDNSAADKVAQGYTTRVNELTEEIRQDPRNWRRYINPIKNLSRDLLQDYRTGPISRMQDNYNRFKAWSDDIDKQTQLFYKTNGKSGLDPATAQVYKAKGLESFKGTNYQSPTLYNTFNTIPVVPNMDLQAELERGLDKMQKDGEIRTNEKGEQEYFNKTTQAWEGLTMERVLPAIMGNVGPQMLQYLKSRQDLGLISGAYDSAGNLIQPYTITQDEKGNSRIQWNSKSFLSNPIQGALAKYTYKRIKTENNLSANPVWQTKFSEANQNTRQEDAQKHAIKLEKLKKTNKLAEMNLKAEQDHEARMDKIRLDPKLLPEQKAALLKEEIDLNSFIQSSERVFTPSQMISKSEEYVKASQDFAEQQRSGRFSLSTIDKLNQLEPMFNSIYQKSASKLGISKEDFDKIIRFQAGDKFGSTIETVMSKVWGPGGTSSPIQEFRPSKEYNRIKALSNKYKDFVSKTKSNVTDLASALANEIEATQVFYHATPGTKGGDFAKALVNNLFNSSSKKELYKADEVIYDSNGNMKAGNIKDKDILNKFTGNFTDNIDPNSLEIRYDSGKLIAKTKTKDGQKFQIAFDNSSTDAEAFLTKAGFTNTEDGKDFLLSIDPQRSSVRSKLANALPLISNKYQHQNIAGIEVTNMGDYYTVKIPGHGITNKVGADERVIKTSKDIEAAILYIKGYNLKDIK